MCKTDKLQSYTQRLSNISTTPVCNWSQNREMWR